MPQRNRYGLNFQTINFARFGDVVPLGYFEVAPGESVSGVLNSRFTSDQADNLILNRTYYDTFLFYVPYRLLDSGWPDFISKETGSVPLVTDLMPRNYENAFQLTDVADAYTENVAWPRYAYNMIWNEYFRQQDVTERALTDNTIAQGYLRESTLYASSRNDANVDETSIDTSGGSFTTRTLRSALANDRFDRIRDYYGDKYTDYLAAVGVQSVWTILEQPEVLGMHHGDLRFTATRATDGANLADIGGVFDGVSKTTVKDKFLPEHGLVYAVGIARMDVQRTAMGGLPILQKDGVHDYWSPAFEVSDMQQLPLTLLGTGHTPSDGVFFSQRFDEYRRGELLIPNLTITSINSYIVVAPATTATTITYRGTEATNIDNFFNGNLTIDAVQYHGQLSNEFKIIKKSPIAKAMKSVLR